MTVTIDPREWPVVFLSYDEPNADLNYQRLLEQRPDAARVHGVRGSDRAHKQCAAQVTTDRFFTVDGDTRVDASFWRHTHDLGGITEGEDTVLSFSSRNVVNGLCYGNGGIKLWQKQSVERMRTHEISAGGDSAVDFCWALDYVLMPGVWAQTLINQSEKQAWRAGFREGVKFSLVEGGECKDPDQWQRRVDQPNLRRLCQWQQIGLDVKNGTWAIFGARQGFYRALLTDWPTDQVRDFDCLEELWREQMAKTPDQLRLEQQQLGRQILDAVSLDITTEPLAADHSRWFKRFAPSEPRQQAKRLRQ
jgi:hypothetical protein